MPSAVLARQWPGSGQALHATAGHVVLHTGRVGMLFHASTQSRASTVEVLPLHEKTKPEKHLLA